MPTNEHTVHALAVVVVVVVVEVEGMEATVFGAGGVLIHTYDLMEDILV